MSTETDISALYREFTDALREVLAENAVGLARRGRLARARAAVKKHPDYSEHAYFLAVETAFKNWEECKTSVVRTGPVAKYERPCQELALPTLLTLPVIGCLVRLDVGSPNYIGPLLCFLNEELAEVSS